MQQFSLYHTNEGALYKTACLLTEKSYHNKLKIVLLTADKEAQEYLNNLLWTYSRRYFIPHGSKLDPFPEKQPIYITDEFENPNEASVLVIIAPFDITAIFDRYEYISSFKRIIIIYDALDESDKIIQIINQLSLATSSIDCYKQNPDGSWGRV